MPLLIDLFTSVTISTKEQHSERSLENNIRKSTRTKLRGDFIDPKSPEHDTVEQHYDRQEYLIDPSSEIARQF